MNSKNASDHEFASATGDSSLLPLPVITPDGTNNIKGLGYLTLLQQYVLIAYAISLPLSMTASWILLITATALMVIEAVMTRNARLFKQPLTVPILVLGGAVGLSGFCNGGIAEAVRSVMKLAGMLIYFPAASQFQNNRNAANGAVFSVLAMASIAGVYGAVQQIFDFHPTKFHYLQGTGFINNPASFSGQMQLFSMLAIGFAVGRIQLPQLQIVLQSWQTALKDFRRGPMATLVWFRSIAVSRVVWLSIVTFVFALCNLAGLIFAGERAAWLGGLAGGAILAALISRKAFVICALVLSMAGAVSFYTVPLVHDRVSSMMSMKNDVSIRVRLEVWQISINEWKKSPLVGIGFLKFPHLDFPEAIVKGVSKDLNHAHNNYLHILSTTGIVGFISYLWLCFAQLINGMRTISRARESNDQWLLAVARGVTAGAAALMISGLFEYNFGSAQVRLAQWFLLALLAISSDHIPQASSRAKSGDLQHDSVQPTADENQRPKK